MGSEVFNGVQDDAIAAAEGPLQSTLLTQSAADFVSGLDFARLPGEAIATVARGFIDCIAVMHLGFDEEVTGILARSEVVSRSGEASVCWGEGRARADIAALVNATAAHALDFDDTGLEGHPSAVLVPMILALGEAVQTDGRRAITAYVAGYEIWAELIRREPDRHHGKGFHPTSLFGPLAAAAAAASLIGLDKERTATALSIAASMASGLVANFGTMTKPYHVGRAAQGGVLAARLAASGMTAATDVLEHPSGFLAAYSPKGAVDRVSPPLFGTDWGILREGLNVKLYPVCYAAHRSIDSMLSIASALEGRVDEVREIRLDIGRLQACMLRCAEPTTALEAKFSAQFAVAAALLAGNVGMSEVSDSFVLRPQTQALLRRVRVSPKDAVDPDQPLFSPADQVEVEMRDGEILKGTAVRYARGHARNPIAFEALQAKFDACVDRRLEQAAKSRLFNLLTRLHETRSIPELYQ